MKKKIFSTVLLHFLFSALICFAQEEETPKANRPPKFVTLTLGIEYDEKLPSMPSSFTFKGDFKKLTGAKFVKEINSIRFTPRAEGIGTLTIHDKTGKKIGEYRLLVRKSRHDTIAREIQSLLGDIEGINIKIVNNKVIVDGQILLPRDMNRIYNVVAQYGDQAASLVTISPLAQKKIAELIARDINNPEIEVRAVNDKFILQGFANSEDEMKRAIVIAKTYIPAVIIDRAEADQVVKKPKPADDGVINLIVVKPQPAEPPKKIVQIVIHYVELSKDYSRGFRFQFMPSLKDDSGIQFQTGSNNGGAISQFTGTITGLLPKLNWAKEHGHARVLESTSILTQDRTPGILNSVRDIPYVTAGNATSPPSTSFKQVGIKSKVTPEVLGERSDSIQLSMEFDISSLAGTSSDGAPLTAANQMATSLVVRSGQSAAIGGLITNQSVTGYNKLPRGVDSNPIISLYASKDFSRGQSQFVVFVTPIIKSSASAGTEKIKKKFRLRD